MDVTVIGGGWAGTAAALEVALLKGKVTLIERTDMLLGTGLAGGIMYNNGRYTVAQEMRGMGGGKLFELIDDNLRHKNISFPGHNHASVYDVLKLPQKIKPFLEAHGVEVVLEKRIRRGEKEGNRIKRIYDEEGKVYESDTYIDCTGTAGPPSSCAKYGHGCGMCILRCPAYGGRKSICGDLGIAEYANKRKDGVGAFSGSCELVKESVASELVEKINKEGKVILPIPEALKHDLLSLKACRQYALAEYRDNAVLLDNGHIKLMSPYFPLKELRKIPGLENALYADPIAGGRGNSVRFTAMAPCDIYMASENIENLFFGGEKSGALVGHTEGIATGTLAGYNAMALIRGKRYLAIPEELGLGDGIAYLHKRRKEDESVRLTFSGGELFERMKNRGSYITHPDEIIRRIKKLNMENIFG